MAHQGRERKTPRLAASIMLLVGVLTALGAQSGVSSAADPGAAALEAAKGSFSAGDTQSALLMLRKLRDNYPDSPSVPDSLALSVEYSLAAGDELRARYFLQVLIDAAPGSPAAFGASLLVARHYYDARSWLAALDYYRKAVDGYREGRSGPRKDMDLALLRAAELALYQEQNADSARGYINRLVPGNLPDSEGPLYRQMRVRLLWSAITPAALGLTDANVSSLRVDGDDLWVGTWNGGVARYSVSAGRGEPFPGPAFSRSIEVADRRVWVGTAEGLDWYGKGSGRWGAEDAFQSPSPRKVQVVRQAGGALYAGTLGDGLFRQSDEGWIEVSDGDLPGRFITSLAEDAAGQRLLIGTMNLGLVMLDLKTGAMSTLAESIPDFTAENITALLPDAEGRVWIGTYGEGLYAWRPADGSLSHYTRATGEIGDDWVLAGCETDRALYFGTFGGGVSMLPKATGRWARIGIADGLGSLDVTAIAWRAPYVFFGTLGAGVSVYDEASDGAQP